MENYYEFDLELLEYLKSEQYHFNKGYLLNTQLETFDTLEKYIFDTASFHLSRPSQDISGNVEEYFVEFWIKETPNLNNLHVDCDEHCQNNDITLYPSISVISYFNNHLYPTLFTDVDHEDYMYKSFERENNLKLVFPRKNTQISFDSSKYHGEIKLNDISDSDDTQERIIIAMNIWKNKPSNIDFYKSNTDKTNRKYNKHEQLLNLVKINEKYTIDADKQFSETLFDELLFKETHSLSLLFKEQIQHCLMNDMYNIVIQDSSIHMNNESFLQAVCIMDELKNIASDDIKVNNRFLQRFIYEKFFSTETCEWIIFEANETGHTNGWNLFRHQHYPTIDIPLQIINPVFKFCAFAFLNLFKQTFKSYCIPEKYTPNIKDMFIIKYDVTTQKSLNTHKDGTHLSFNIMLSDIHDYESGGTYFDDGLSYYLNRGDVLVHSGYINHGSYNITKGVRYILVVFFDIIER